MLTAEQKEARRKFIGSSDISAVLGMNPYRTAEDVRLDKAGKLEEWAGNEATTAGTYLEPAILAWAEDELDVDLVRNQMHVHANKIMAANTDAEGMNSNSQGDDVLFVVEAKTSGIVGQPYGDWGAPGTDEVPKMHLVQVMHQLACCGPDYKRGYVASLIGGYGFRMFVVERSDELIAAIESVAVKFWNENVLCDKPAPNSLASLDVLKRVKRQPGAVMPIDPKAWIDFAKLRSEASELDKRLEAAKRRVLNLAGEAEAVSVDGVVVANYSKDKRGVRSLKVKEHTQTEVAA